MLLLKRLSASTAMVGLAGSLGCLYIPPLSHATGKKTVVALRPEAETRASLQVKLGDPDVVDLASVQVWAWRQNLGSIIGGAPMGGGGFDLQGGYFRVLARYDGDRVVALETELQPPLKPILKGPPLPAPTERTVLEPAPATEGPRHYRAWVGPDGTLFACGWTGDLWVRAPGAPRATLAAQLSSLSGKGSRNGTVASLSENGQLLALAREDRVWVWDARTSQVAASLPALEPDSRPSTGSVGSTACLSPDGTRLAIAASRSSGWRGKLGSSLRVVDTATWKVLWSLPGIEVRNLAFSSDGIRLLVDGSLFESATGRRITSAPPSRAEVLPGGRLQLLLGEDLLLQELGTGRLLGRLTLRSGPADKSAVQRGMGGFNARLLPEGSLLAVGNGILVRWDLGPLLAGAGESATGLQPAVRLLPLRQHYEGSLMDPKWELEPTFAWQLSPDGVFLLEQGFVYRQFGAQHYFAAKFLRILDARTLQTLWEEWPPREEWGETRFLEDGRLLRTVNGEIRLWTLPAKR